MGSAVHQAVLVDDHPLLGLSLKAALGPRGVALELIEPGPVEELVSLVTARAPDLVVVDLGMPIPGGGVSLIEPLTAAELTVAVLTGESDLALLASAAKAGAAVVVAKTEPIEEILDIICRLAIGESVRPHQRSILIDADRRLTAEREERLGPFATLSGREREVLAGLMAGKSPIELAEESFHSVHTVRTQVKAILRKLGVRSQVEAVAHAYDVGWRHQSDAADR